MPNKLQGAAAEYLAAKFGGDLAEDETSGQVGTSVGQLLGNDPECVMLLLVNLSSNVVVFGFDESVSLTKGIRLGASGGSAEIDVESDGMLPTRSIYAIADGASSDVYILRVRRFYKSGNQGGN